MRGFTTDAVVILPTKEKFDNMQIEQRRYLIKSYNNIKRYLSEKSMFLSLYNTTELEVDATESDIVGIATPEDSTFIDANCGMTTYKTTLRLDKIWKEVRQKYPVKRGLGVVERFNDIVIPRIKMTSKLYLDTKPFIITFESASTAMYKVPLTDHGNIVWYINTINFTSQAYMGESKYSMSVLTQDGYTNEPVYSWFK